MNKKLDLFVVPKNKVKKRPLQIGREIKSIITDLLLRGKVVDTLLFDTSLIITDVIVASDLTLAKIYVYPNSQNANPEKIVKALQKHSGFFKKHIGKELHIKVVPNLFFFKDEQFDKIEEIEKLFNNLPKGKENTTQED